MRLLILFLILVAVFSAGCTESELDEATVKTNGLNMGNFIDYVAVQPFCQDKVVCYVVKSGYGASGSCFRDEDLVVKYCTEI